MQRICAAPAPAGQAGTRVGDTFFFVFFLLILLNKAGKNVKLVGRLKRDQCEKRPGTL